MRKISHFLMLVVVIILTSCAQHPIDKSIFDELTMEEKEQCALKDSTFEESYGILKLMNNPTRFKLKDKARFREVTYSDFLEFMSLSYKLGEDSISREQQILILKKKYPLVFEFMTYGINEDELKN